MALKIPNPQQIQEALKPLASPLTIGLTGLLVVQLLLAAAWSVGDGTDAISGSRPLMEFTADAVESIEIQGPDGEPLVLKRGEETWIIPALGDFSADDTRVDELLKSLGEISTRLPVATTADAARRFKVADDGFERRLTLSADDGRKQVLLLGDSAGFRRMYVRRAGDEGIYDVGLGLFQFDVDSDDWIEKDLLALEVDDIQRLERDDLTLIRDQDQGWRLEGIAEGETLRVNDVESAVDKLAKLRIESLTPPDPESASTDTVAELKVTLTDGKTLTYRLMGQEPKRQLSRSDIQRRFGLLEYEAEVFDELQRAALVDAPPAADEPSPAPEEPPVATETQPQNDPAAPAN